MGISHENLLPSFFLFSLLIFLISSMVEGSKPARLFVFGDSYADTGNIKRSLSNSWKKPYGMTFPGVASGRFSDGRVLTDFVARYMGLRTPIPYTWRALAPEKASCGVNFAFGGTGVFNTTATIKIGLPNMTTQIDFFQQMLAGNDVVRVNPNLADSLVFVSLVGNDYNTFLSEGGSVQGLPGFIVKVVDQLAVNLQRLHSLGGRRILLTGLQPLGCVPLNTAANAFEQCNSTYNAAVQLHNRLLQLAVAAINNQSAAADVPPIVVLDLYDSFNRAFQAKDIHSGGLRFETPLKPCCIGVNSSSVCSDVDENGNKLYTVCDNPNSAFFWDTYHPTQAGWRAVYRILKGTLHQVFYS